MSSSFLPASGDLVSYKGGVFYFQPNGSSCYLYKNRDDIGNRDLAAYTPARRSIKKPTPAEIAAHVRPAQPRQSPREAIESLTEKLFAMNLKDEVAADSSKSRAKKSTEEGDS